MVKVEISRKHLAPNLGASVVYLGKEKLLGTDMIRQALNWELGPTLLLLVSFKIVVAGLDKWNY